MTTFPKVIDHARYKPNDPENNRILLLALWEAWGKRCYIGRCTKDLSEFQIDHLIPSSLDQLKIDALIKSKDGSYLYHHPFDVHAPYNLAPACSAHNRDKSDKTFFETMQFAMAMKAAEKKQSTVEKRVAEFYKKGAVTELLLKLSAADLSDAASKQALLDIGPLVVSRLQLLAPKALLGDSFYDFDDARADDAERVLVTIDEATRRAIVVLEDVEGGNFDDLLSATVVAVRGELHSVIKSDIEAKLAEGGHEDAFVEYVSCSSTIEILEVRRVDDQFEVRGIFEAEGTGNAAVDNGSNDSGTSWLDEYADPIQGSFTAPAWIADNSSAEASDVELSITTEELQ